MQHNDAALEWKVSLFLHILIISVTAFLWNVKQFHPVKMSNICFRRSYFPHQKTDFRPGNNDAAPVHLYTKTFPFMVLKSWRRQVLNVVFDVPSGSWVSLEPIRLVPVSVSNTQLLGGQVAAPPQLSSKHPPAVAAVTLHELRYEFGVTVNGAKTKAWAATKESKWKAAS